MKWLKHKLYVYDKHLHNKSGFFIPELSMFLRHAKGSDFDEHSIKKSQQMDQIKPVLIGLIFLGGLICVPIGLVLYSR